jgi:hypothetical protein
MTRFRQVKAATDLRPETALHEQGRRRGQLPVQEVVPTDEPVLTSPQK